MSRHQLFLILAATAAVLGPPSVAAQTPTSPSEPVVVVQGDGLVKAMPDQAWVTLAVESRSRNPKEAQAQSATAMTAVQQKIFAVGIPKDAVRTLAVDLRAEYDFVNGRQVPRGYVARNTIEVRLDDIGRVGEVMDIGVTSGATAVRGPRFDLKDRNALEREALKRATADARARAEAAASGAGRAIDRVVRIEEPSGGRPLPPPVPMMMEARMQDSRPETPVIAGEIEIRATVILTATIK